jgi:ribosomal-protein-alanine N-acetyltransferase
MAVTRRPGPFAFGLYIYILPMRIDFPGGQIRPWHAADAKPLVPLADNRNIWLNLRDRFPNPYGLADAKRWVRQASDQKPVCHFAIEYDGALAGGIGLIPGEDVHHRSAEVGYWLGEPFWGRGLMTHALTAFSNFAFPAYDLSRLFALVLEWNTASTRVLEKVGFALEGRLRKSAFKDGKEVDEFLYAKII